MWGGGREDGGKSDERGGVSEGCAGGEVRRASEMREEGQAKQGDIQGETHTFGLVVAGTMTMMEGGVTGQALRGEARP